MFHSTELALTTWFLAICHPSRSKGGMSSVELTRRLGTRQPTAWLIKHKLMAVMAAREAGSPGSGGGSRWTTPVLPDGGSRSRLRSLLMVAGSGPGAARRVPFTRVDTALGTIKTARAGTRHHVSPRHAQRYLASLAWRFNRRYRLGSLTERVACACARTPPHPCRVIIAG